MKVSDAELTSITAVPDGYLAGGCRYGTSSDGTVSCHQALLLKSPDGRRWTEVPLPQADNREILVLADTQLGLLALGRTIAPQPPAIRVIWRSRDGASWEPFSVPVPDTIVFEQVFVLADRTAFLGADYAFDMPASDVSWSTADGDTWTEGTTPLGPKVAAQPGIVSAGLQCFDVCEDPLVALKVYRSSDGAHWSEDEIPPGISMLEGPTFGARDGRALLAGLSRVDAPAAVIWADGADGWRSTELADGLGYGVDRILAAGNQTLVIGSGASADAAKAWLSRDGETYVLVEWPARVFVGAATDASPLVLVVNGDELWIATF